MIYVVEDDRDIRELVVYALTSAGYEAEACRGAAEFFSRLDPAAAQLVILDIMMPGQDGLSALRRLKAAGETARIPCMMMSALGTEYDKVKGLDTGADDYLAKPFGIMELLARVRALIRRGETADCLRSGGVRLYPASRRAQADGEEVSLTVKEFDLLEYLMRSPGKAVRREELLGAVWGYSGGEETRTVDVHIRSLRRKLKAAGELINTVRGVGYMVERE